MSAFESRVYVAAMAVSLAEYGVFFEGQEGTLEFRPLPPPSDDEVGVVLAREVMSARVIFGAADARP